MGCSSTGHWTSRALPRACSGAQSHSDGRVPDTAEHDLLPRKLRHRRWRCNLEIAACARALLWSRAIWLLFDLQRHSLRPDVVGYNSAVDACARAAHWWLGLWLLSSLEVQTLSPDGKTYGSILKGCERAGKWQQVLQIVHLLCCRLGERAGEQRELLDVGPCGHQLHLCHRCLCRTGTLGTRLGTLAIDAEMPTCAKQVQPKCLRDGMRKGCSMDAKLRITGYSTPLLYALGHWSLWQSAAHLRCRDKMASWHHVAGRDESP